MDMKYGKSDRFVAIATKSRGEANSRPRWRTVISEAHLQINLTALNHYYRTGSPPHRARFGSPLRKARR